MRKGRGFRILALITVLVAAPAVRAAVIVKSVPQLAVEAERIVIGDVIAVSSLWTLDRAEIKTTVTLSISDDLKGGGDALIEFPLPGGTIDDITAYVSASPTLVAGDHVLLFLAGDPYRLVGAYQGAYLTDGIEAVQTEGGPPMVAETTQRSLEALISEISAALPPGSVPSAIASYQGDFQLPGALRYGLLQCNWVYMPFPMGEMYKINPNWDCTGPSCGSTSQRISAIRSGPAAWDAVAANFRFTYGGTIGATQTALDGVNLVYFEQGSSLGTETVAQTTLWCFQSVRMVEWDIAFNDHGFDFWSGQDATCPAGTYDVKGISTHEFGHGLGLGHSAYSAATMFGGIGPCLTFQRDLDIDDIDGIRAIYGVCGNGFTEGPEQCDDGAMVPGDGCSPQCRFEPFTGNNQCADAIPVPDGIYNFDTTNATTDGPNEPTICKFAGDSQINRDVWFSYHATCTGNGSIRLCGSSFDTKMAVYAGLACPTAESAIACNDDSNLCSPGFLQSALSMPMVAGQDYLIRVGGYGVEAGLGTLTIEGAICPSNDDCVNQVPVGDGQTFFDTRGATTDGPNEPAVCDFFNFTQVAQDIWFCYEATCSGVVTVDLCGSLYDTKVAAYDGCSCPTIPSAIACNDDACNLQSRVMFSAAQGSSYLLRIGGYQGATDAGSMVITCTTVECMADGDCNDGDACTDDFCFDSLCRHLPNNEGACDDGDPCTAGDSCFEGLCVGGTPIDCDNQLFCDGQESCADGVCVAGGPPCGPDSWCDEEGQSCIVAPDDIDQDGDVDMKDLFEFQGCFGPYTDPRCQSFDITPRGGVIDLSDWREFHLRMTGPNG